MTEDEHLLTCLGEECAEVVKNVSKALRFGLDDYAPDSLLDNREAIRQEFLDILGVMNLLVERGIILEENNEEKHIKAKQDKVLHFIKVAKKLGTIK